MCIPGSELARVAQGSEEQLVAEILGMIHSVLTDMSPKLINQGPKSTSCQFIGNLIDLNNKLRSEFGTLRATKNTLKK